jgi:hypothetical protein
VDGEPYVFLVCLQFGTRIEEAMESESRHERAARNQSLFREVNERIEAEAQAFGPMFTEFICECADESCVEHVSLTLEEYSAIRNSSPVLFFVKPGHIVPVVERVVGGEGDRYELVEKLDEAAEVAFELDPRAEAPSQRSA